MQIYTYNKKLQQSLMCPEIRKLVNYLFKLEEPVILREIRSNFPDYRHLDRDLDLLIENEIISRQNRRYDFSLSVLKEYPTGELVKAFIQQVNDQYSNEELLVWLADELWSDKLDNTIAIDFALPTISRLENEDFQLVTINRGGKLSETLANYFENSEQPNLFPTLSVLIGDVNPEFFSNQLSLILDQVLLGKKPKRESIFLDSLLATHIVTSRPEWQLAIPIYTENISCNVVQEMNNETRFFFVRQLAKELLGKRESFSYLIKKKA
ncbi:DUF1803 domain-containing protein [Enterococcus sp. AZ196]|uniref:DUF1803 domain-containing protein n=1 Tax=Enterococcus sp. AZ196 TaxID=2774659 RepID=UPI003D2AD33D